MTKWFFPILLIFALPVFSQYDPDSIFFYYPDTTLSTEKSLILIEDSTGIYFSYNPANLPLLEDLNISPGRWSLSVFLNWMSNRMKLEYTPIGNQIVLHPPGEDPLICIPGTGETKLDYLVIRGRVLSLKELDPLPYCTVWVPSTWKGTVTNSEGNFVMKIPELEIPDSIAISCIGYRTRIIPLDELRDSMNVIELSTSIIPIQEVIIRRTEPNTLIQQALDRMPDNYFQDPVMETAFYRESIRKNGIYINVSEAVLSIYKPGNGSPLREQVKVLRGRKNLDIRKTDTVLVKLQAGMRTSFLLDIARYLPDFLKEDRLQHYQFRMADIITMQGKPVYAIDFSKKSISPHPHYQGRLYIDLESLAFTGTEFEINPETISQSSQSMVLKKPRQYRVRPIAASYKVWYKSDGNKFYPSMVRAENIFRIRKRIKLFPNEYHTVSEMAVTQLKTQDVTRFRMRETARITDIFADLLGGSSRAFWGRYNYMVPEQSIEETIRGFNSGD